jgi:Kef-type K+ transport system membrane component KefB
MTSLLVEIGIILIAATLLAYGARLLRQPLIIGYILAGILLGPVGVGLVTDVHTITLLAEIGIAFLLFIVGLELDVRKIKNLGVTALLIALGQIVFTFGISYAVAIAFGFSFLPAMYLSMALTLSSTVLVIKVLSDKDELETLHGRLALGILLVQDVVAVLALSIFASFSEFSLTLIGAALLKGLIFLVVVALLAKYILPFIFRDMAKSQELLFLSAISWMFLLIVVSHYLELSIAVGSFLAGITLATLPYNIEIVGKSISLRDFFITLFFVTLGMQVTIPAITSSVTPIIFFTFFVVVGNIVIVMVVTSLLGFKSRVAFATATSVSQISEFSLILVTVGFTAGHITQNMLSLVAMLAVTTFTISSYLITYNRQLYQWLKPVLKLFDNLSNKHQEMSNMAARYQPEVVLFGKNRLGYDILDIARKHKKSILIVDFNPEIIEHLREQKIPALYGDLSDPETLSTIHFTNARVVVSTVDSVADNLLLINKVKRKNKKTKLFVTTTTIKDAFVLYEAGAHYVIMPHLLGGERVSYMLRNIFNNKGSLVSLKNEHIATLRKRHEH